MCDSVALLGILGGGVTLMYSVSHTEFTYFLSKIMELDFLFFGKTLLFTCKKQTRGVKTTTIKSIRATTQLVL